MEKGDLVKMIQIVRSRYHQQKLQPPNKRMTFYKIMERVVEEAGYRGEEALIEVSELAKEHARQRRLWTEVRKNRALTR